MIPRFLVVFAGVVFAALPLTARVDQQTEGWKTYSYPVCGFSIAFPSPPTVSTKHDPLDLFNENPPTTYRYGVELQGGALVATASDLSGYADKKTSSEELLRVYRDANLKQLSACTVKERPVASGAHSGIEIEAQCKDMALVERLYVAELMLYDLTAAGEPGRALPEARRFFESFTLIPRTKAPLPKK